MHKSESIVKLAPALIKAKAAMGNVFKDKDGYVAKYADLPQVVDTINAALLPHELVFLQLIGYIHEEKVSIENLLIHSSGEYITSIAETYLDDKMKSKVQSAGASTTYLARKSALRFFFLAEEDMTDKLDHSLNDEPMEKLGRPNPFQLTHLAHLESAIEKTPNPAETLSVIYNRHQVDDIRNLSDNDMVNWIKAIEKKLSKKD